MSKCDWHKGDSEDDVGLTCPDCSRLLATKNCEGCGKAFLDWESRGYDDIVAAPAATSSGDLVCVRCVRDYDHEDEDGEDYDFDVEDDLVEDGL